MKIRDRLFWISVLFLVVYLIIVRFSSEVLWNRVSLLVRGFVLLICFVVTSTIFFINMMEAVRQYRQYRQRRKPDLQHVTSSSLMVVISAYWIGDRLVWNGSSPFWFFMSHYVIILLIAVALLYQWRRSDRHVPQSPKHETNKEE